MEVEDTVHEEEEEVWWGQEGMSSVVWDRLVLGGEREVVEVYSPYKVLKKDGVEQDVW